MNWGSKAVKKMMALGFDIWSRKPSRRNRRPLFAEGAVPAFSSTLVLLNTARSPRKIKYAAPIHFTAKKSLKDEMIKAPTLVAESTKYTALADRIPRMDAMLLQGPD